MILSSQNALDFHQTLHIDILLKQLYWTLCLSNCDESLHVCFNCVHVTNHSPVLVPTSITGPSKLQLDLCLAIQMKAITQDLQNTKPSCLPCQKVAETHIETYVYVTTMHGTITV